jgi:hypothetical protein
MIIYGIVFKNRGNITIPNKVLNMLKSNPWTRITGYILTQ